MQSFLQQVCNLNVSSKNTLNYFKPIFAKEPQETNATQPTEASDATKPTEVSVATKPTEGSVATKPTEVSDATKPTEVSDATKPSKKPETPIEPVLEPGTKPQSKPTFQLMERCAGIIFYNIPFTRCRTTCRGSLQLPFLSCSLPNAKCCLSWWWLI